MHKISKSAAGNEWKAMTTKMTKPSYNFSYKD